MSDQNVEQFEWSSTKSALNEWDRFNHDCMTDDLVGKSRNGLDNAV